MKLDSDVLSALDRSNVSNRDATLIMASTINIVKDADTIKRCAISPATIQRARIRNRNEVAQKIRQNFQCSSPLTLHWDGKIVAALLGRKKVDRLAIVVSGVGVQQLIAVPGIEGKCTGRKMCDEITKSLKEWNIFEEISCLSFDTTSSNTGVRNGAATFLEKEMSKQCLNLACRHHINEIILGATYDACCGVSSGPETTIFNDLRKEWETLDKTKYRTIVQSKELKKIFTDELAQETLQFAIDQLENGNHARGDYVELLNLIVIFLGGVPHGGIHFNACAGTSRARWMAFIIYDLKLYMFGRTIAIPGLFKITPQQEERIIRFLKFVIKGGYIMSWFCVPSAACAPKNDIKFIERLMLFKKEDNRIAKIAIEKILKHLWYISEVLIGLSFFDESIGNNEKQKMIANLKRESNDKSNRKKIEYRNLVKTNWNISAFVTSQTMFFFEVLKLRTGFLSKPPLEWAYDEDYKESKVVVDSLLVVNDVAERAIALIQKYNKNLTIDEQQFQSVLQVVSSHRSQIKTKSKKEIMSFLNRPNKN